MSKSSIDVQKWLRGPVTLADSERSLRPSRLDSRRGQPGSAKLRFLKSWLETKVGCDALEAIQTRRHREPGCSALPAPWLGAASHLVAIGRLAPWVACAGVLSIAWPAAAQDAAAPDKAQPAPDKAQPPPEKSPEAAAPPTQQGADAPPPQAPPEAAPAEAEEAEQAEEAEEIPTSSAQSPQNLEEITVSGRRQSLAAALRRKRNSTTQVDAIVADDMAKFPDLNLAEALERVPGVSITRTNGEGARISVRGLSGRYTRTRVNGIDARVALGTNTTREFDFNLFASELFNSIVVHKTATAELGEGSLGSVIDLNTGRAFNYKEGFSFLLSTQGNYNDLSQTVRPRLAGLVAYRDPKGLWGATTSAAYSVVRSDSNAAETVRWQKSAFRSVRGVICADNPTDPGCVEVTDAFHARIPRYLQREVSAQRLGLTAGVELKPTKQTDIKLDALYASYNTQDRYKTLEVLFRGNEQLMDVTDYTLQLQPGRFGVGNNTLTGLSVNNAWVRSESFLEKQENDFKQISLNLDHDFGHGFSVNAVGGMVRSVGRVPHSTTLMYDNRAYNGFSYDFGQDDRFPRLTFAGADVADGANFSLTEVRDQVTKTTNAFDSVAVKGAWEIFQPLTVSIGGKFESARQDTRQDNRDGTVCGLMLYDCDADDNGTNELIGAPGQASLSDIVNYGGRVGTGTTTRWAAPSLDGWTQALGYYNVPLQPNLNNIRKVKEDTLGAFLQGDGEVPLGDMRLLYNAGVRYVQTRQTSGGYLGLVYTETERPMYDNLLWSTNAALWVTEDVVIRGAVAEVMARPELQELSPGATVDSFGFKVNYQNSLLEPTKAMAYDAGAEWYFADESVISLALFLKDIKSYPLQQSEVGTFASTGLPFEALAPTSPASMNPEGTCANAATTGCWEINRLQNGPGASLKGLEVGLQAPFSSLYGGLPPIIRSMGFSGNFTLIDSRRDYPFGTNPVTMEKIVVRDRLFSLSNTSVNATLYYEDSKFGARLSLANRSQYLSGSPVSGNLFEYTEGTTRLDFSSNYKVMKQLEVTLEALNLTNTPTATGVDIDAKRRFAYTRTGRNFLLGARFTY